MLKIKTECLLLSFKNMKSLETNHEEYMRLIGAVEGIELVLSFINDIDGKNLIQ